MMLYFLWRQKYTHVHAYMHTRSARRTRVIHNAMFPWPQTHTHGDTCIHTYMHAYTRIAWFRCIWFYFSLTWDKNAHINTCIHAVCVIQMYIWCCWSLCALKYLNHIHKYIHSMRDSDVHDVVFLWLAPSHCNPGERGIPGVPGQLVSLHVCI
jgi:hypothetical protein